MRLAALYTVWNGLELLNGSINQIKDSVDVIFIGWQYKSNKGEVSQEVEAFLEQYENDEKIILVEFMPDFRNNTKLNELNKHNLLLEEARAFGCSHFFISATDHYYNPQEFRNAKELINVNNYDVTLSSMFTYYKRPEWRIEPPESYLMPFICKINKETKFAFSGAYPFDVDPSLKVFPLKNVHNFKRGVLIMHHFSMIRKDIENKFNNAAASIRWTPSKINNFIKEYNEAKEGDSISYFGGRKIKSVENIFNIE